MKAGWGHRVDVQSLTHCSVQEELLPFLSLLPPESILDSGLTDLGACGSFLASRGLELLGAPPARLPGSGTLHSPGCVLRPLPCLSPQAFL